ncbi:MAG: hypothetical protein WC356_01225 [Candidatus Micrarchaeia archaeon]|jgi:hypothetical protein
MIHKELVFSKERVLFSGTPNAKLVRTLETKMDFFELHELCRNFPNEFAIIGKSKIFKGKPLPIKDLETALVFDKEFIPKLCRDNRIRNQEYYNFFPNPKYILIPKLFAIPPIGKTIGEYFEVFIPHFDSHVVIEVPKGKRDLPNMALIINACCFNFEKKDNVFVLTLDKVNDIICHPVPEEEYGECHIDIRTGLPNPEVLDRYKGPKRFFLRDKNKEPKVYALQRDTGCQFDLVDMTYDLSEENLKKYKSIWVFE